MRNYRGIPIGGKDFFVYGWYFERAGGSYIIPITDKYHTPASFVLTSVPVIPESVGQATGLKDKNGKGNEIYQQDDIMGLYNGTKYLVYWDSEYGQWWGRPIKESIGRFARSLSELLEQYHMEIIGSIHTHPELTKKNRA